MVDLNLVDFENGRVFEKRWHIFVTVHICQFTDGLVFCHYEEITRGGPITVRRPYK